MPFVQMDRSLIKGYHFKMLEERPLRIEGNCYTYTSLCDLEMVMHNIGSVMRFPPHRAVREVSWTFLRFEPVAPSTPTVPQHGSAAVGTRFSEEPRCNTLPRYFMKRKRSPATPEEVSRASNIVGPSRRCSMWDKEGNSTEVAKDKHDSAFDTVEEMEVEDHADDCVEVICIEDSVEIVDLISDSDSEEEDPSEGSSAPLT